MAGVFYVSIEGTKQGKFKGESRRATAKDRLEGLTFSYEVGSPRDAATGQASGRRTHLPVVFTKPWGAASPQLVQAVVTNEVLKTVLFEFVGTNPNGEEEVFATIRLTNAAVTNLKRTVDEHSAEGARGLDVVTLTFQKIEHESKTGKTMAVDDWQR
jgi:type VI secretion system secreted protein Hcp